MQRVVWSTIIERCAVRALDPRVCQCVPGHRVWCGPLATAVPAHTGGRWVPCETIVMRPWRAPATMTTAWWWCCCCRCCYLSFPPDNGGSPAAHGRCVRRYRVVVEVNNLLLNPLPNSPFFIQASISPLILSQEKKMYNTRREIRHRCSREAKKSCNACTIRPTHSEIGWPLSGG